MPRLHLPKRWRLFAALGAALLIVAGYLLLGGGGDRATTLVVHRADTAREVRVTGSVTAAKSADLGFAESGRILATYAKVGQHVAAGTILAEIENGDQVAALNKAEADLADLEAGTRPEEVAIDETAVSNAETVLAAAIKSAFVSADDAVLNRADALFQNPLSSPAFIYPRSGWLAEDLRRGRIAAGEALVNWPEGGTDPEAAAADVQARLAVITTLLDNLARGLSEYDAVHPQTSAVTTAETSIATARTNVADADAAIAADKNALATARKNLTLAQAGATAGGLSAKRALVASAAAALRKTRVIAPFAGVVTKMDAKAGEIVSPATSEIAMQSDGVYQIEAYTPEVSIAGVAVGDPATTTLDAYGPTVPFAAQVIAVDPAETEKNGVPTYKTTLTFLTADARVRSGMTVDVVITTGVLPDALVVPAGVVGRDAGGAYVTVMVGSKRERRAVETGTSPSFGRVEITSGLTDGESVALTP